MILSSILSLFLTTKMKNLIKSRKGQVKLNEVPNMVTVLLVIGLMIFIGVFLFVEFRDTSKVTANSAEVVNETITTILNETSGSPWNLTAGTLNVDCVATILHFHNGTSGDVVDAANFTVAACTVASADVGQFNGSIVNVTYTYTFTEQDNFYNQTRNAQEGVTNLSDFQNLFGLVIAASVILGLIFVLRRF